MFQNVWVASLFTLSLIFLIPITGAHIINYLEKRFFVHLPKWLLISGIIGFTFVVEGVLTYLFAASLQWTWMDSQFTIGFLVFILVWFMQFNEFIGNRYANVDNQVFGNGKEIYNIELFHFKLNPISIATLLYFLSAIFIAVLSI